jgi:hypothetical protein
VKRGRKVEELQKLYRRSENIVYRKIESESILVPIKDNLGDMGSIYNLNEVGAFVWDHLDGQNRLEDIKNRMLEVFEVSAEKAEQDLLDFVGQLKAVEAIVPIEDTSTSRRSSGT